MPRSEPSRGGRRRHPLDLAPTVPDTIRGPASEAIFRSVLYPNSDEAPASGREPPEYFRDLQLDRIVQDVTADWKEYDLSPLYSARLADVDAITYRQEVVRDLQSEATRSSVVRFVERMRAMRARGAKARQDDRWAVARAFLGGAEIYVDAVVGLARDLADAGVGSRALRALREYLTAYTSSFAFRELARETADLQESLRAVRYDVLIRGSAVTVLAASGEPDYSAVVEETFARFRPPTRSLDGGRGTKSLEYRDRYAGTNHVQAQVVEKLALRYAGPFQSLECFCEKHAECFDERICRFDREAPFYLAYLAHVRRLGEAGLRFCLPVVSDSKEIEARQVFDMALAGTLGAEGATVVVNDFQLRNPERLLVVTGPNEGGKTTFARAFGQLHHLASLGLPVPGTEARLFLCDRIFTHFEREEQAASLRGKLQSDLQRIRDILREATSRSLVVLNEVFSSTSLHDALFLSRKIMCRLSELDLPGVWVTFLDELASFDERTVSLVAGVKPQDPAVRTFRIERRPADGMAYAMSVAEKYRVTRDWIPRRLSR